MRSGSRVLSGAWFLPGIRVRVPARATHGPRGTGRRMVMEAEPALSMANWQTVNYFI